MLQRYVNILSDQREELTNRHWKNIVTREEEKEINLNSPLAQVVIGVRRSGKSTLCSKVMLESGLPFGYINFDDDRLGKLTVDAFDTLLRALYQLNGDFNHLFLDEVQNIEGWELFVNRMLRQGMHMLITGSNANLLSGELATHLTGRYHQIELMPFSFQEYCSCKDVNTSSYTTKAIALRDKALNDYLFAGGFPELLLLSEAEQGDYVRSLVRTIVEKDIAKRYKLRYAQTLMDVANQVLDEFSQEHSFATVQKKHNLKSPNTAKKYLQYLQNAYLVLALPRFSLKSSERRSVHKYYAIDPAMIAKRDDALMTESLGLRLENMVAVELKRRAAIDEQIYYFRKVREYEVDFVRVKGTQVQEMIQVTYDFTQPRTKLYNREVGNLVKASNVLHCDNLTLVMMYGEPRDIVEGGKTIHCVLATDWLLR
ncbi:MAG: ATP-binding protein [Paludibacteraceae bacterium]|nr:ATP-binding protein [Paludibacteraceae bacterium]